MSQTHGDLSGARPNPDYSACEQSLTHITHPSIQQYPPSHQYQPQYHHYHHQPHHQYARPQQQQQRPPDGAPSASGPQPLPGGGVSIYESRSGLGPGPVQTQHQPSFPEAPRLGGGPSVCDSQASPQDFFGAPQVYDNSMMLKEQGIGGMGAAGGGGDPEDNVNDDNDDRDGGDLDDGADGNSQGSGKRSRTRRPHLQGRFSGRLTTKEDERRLAEECKLLGPLLGGVGKRGDKSRLTLAKIVRGIATGDVRRFCEERERAIAALKAKLAAIDPEAAASVPVHAIPLPSAGLGPMGGISLGPMSGLGGSMGLGSLGGGMGLGSGGGLGGAGGALGLGMSMGVHGPQLEKLQRENSELRSEVYGLRMELQARERLLLELQDTGIISGFVPTSIPMDDPQRLIAQPSAGAGAGAGGHLGGAGGGRSQSTDMAPSYSMPQRHHSYSAQPMTSYGGPSQMSLPQVGGGRSSAMEPGPMGGGSGGLGLGPGMAQQAASGPPGMQPGGGGGGGGPMVGESSALAAMPAMSEHSRASRPLKRPAMPAELGGGGGGAAYGEVPRSMSHPPLGRGGAGGGGGGYPHIDLQQQLNSLQAQVEQLQNLSQAQVSGRAAANFLMPARERGGPQVRMGGGGGQLHYGGGGGGGGMTASPFMSSLSAGAQGGLMMLPGQQTSDASAHPFQAHPAIGGPLHLQPSNPGGGAPF
ncbi:hypothetical protein PLESTF_001414800 [Pleodorina starrii]|nr:hypothetical protein PLESTF_001414800 [Pleodorina starrii]